MGSYRSASRETFICLFASIFLASWSIFATVLPSLHAAPGDVIVYVDANATGDANGTSWEDAFTDLMLALTIAQPNHTIWVARGVYYPVDPGGLRTVSFNIPNGVEVYGGFAGTETDLSQRDWVANKTILSGDIGRDDITEDGVVTSPDGIVGDNTAHLVTINNADESTVLDGLIITGAQATSTDFVQDGAGMRMLNSSPILRNLVFSGNSAWANGGAIYSSNSNPVISNTRFVNNTAYDSGGAIFNNNSNPKIDNASFSKNVAQQDGGAIANENNSSPTIIDSSFSDNSANYSGAIHNVGGSSPTITRVSFSGNSATRDGGAISCHYNCKMIISDSQFTNNSTGPVGRGGGVVGGPGSTPTMTKVHFSNNTAYAGGGVYVDNDSAPTINNARFIGNEADSGGGVFLYNSAHLVMTDLLFAGNSARFGAGMTVDSNLTLTNAVFIGNKAEERGGGMDVFGEATLTNTTFSGNSAPLGGAVYNRRVVNLHNSILWANSSEVTRSDPNTTNFTSSYSLISGCKLGGVWNHACGNDGGGNLADAEPLFVSPVSHASAPTTAGDLHLLPGSPAIDKGNNAFNATTTDLDGKPRIIDTHIDLGAYEALPQLKTFVVGSGTLDYSPVLDQYPYDTTVSLTAVAKSGWSFAGWSGDLSGTTSPSTLQMNASKVITATFSNDPPTAHAGNDQTVLIGAQVTLNGSASSDADPDQTLSYKWTQKAGPQVVLSDPESAVTTFTAPNSAGQLIFELVVTDNLGAVSLADSVTITVTEDTSEVPRQPIADAGPDQSVPAGSTVTLDGSASYSPDGYTPLSYSWQQTAGPSVVLTGANTAKPSFTAPASASELTFVLVVIDSQGVTSVPDSVTIRVEASGASQRTIYLPIVKN